MSLRTKLLAVVVGLNGVILLLALFLLVRGEGATPSSALVPLLSASRADVGSSLARWDAHVDGVWVIAIDTTGGPGGGAPGPLPRVYDGRAWFRAPIGAEPSPLERVPEEAFALDAYRRAQEAGAGPVSVDRGVLVSRLEDDRDKRRQWWLVAQLREPERGARDVYVVMLVGMVLLSVVAFLLVSRLVVKPLAALTHAAGRVAAGDHSVRVAPPGGNDELARTTAAFNRMAQEIEEYQAHLEDRVLSSLSQIKRAEQHLAIAQRLAATGKLASGIAHEINNPLGGMKNAVRALARGDLPAQKTAEYLDLIGDGLTRVEETVTKVLSFTPRRVEPRPVDLAEVAKKALALARHRIEKKGIRVAGRAPPEGEARVFGDPLELQQVALNLLLNSADAIEEGKTGTIEVEVANHGAEEVVLRVTDNGSGMTPEDQARCFDLFFTTKEVGEGSGLGLSVVHNIVTNHGGRVEVESAPGQGTTFRVYLPREPATPPGPASSRRTPEPAGPMTGR